MGLLSLLRDMQRDDYLLEENGITEPNTRFTILVDNPQIILHTSHIVPPSGEFKEMMHEFAGLMGSRGMASYTLGEEEHNTTNLPAALRQFTMGTLMYHGSKSPARLIYQYDEECMPAKNSSTLVTFSRPISSGLDERFFHDIDTYLHIVRKYQRR